jgi:excisionase family DNA binding protein
MSKMEKANFTVREAANRLGCNKRTVYRAIWEKRLKAKTKQGKEKYLISEQELERFKPGKDILYNLYVEKGLSIRQIEKQLGRSKDKIHRMLKQYEIERRTRGSGKRGPGKRRSKLEGYSVRDLEKRIARDDMAKAAEDLGITRQTLWRYMKKRKRKRA